MASEPVLSSDVGKRTSRDLNPVIVISAIVKMAGAEGGKREFKEADGEFDRSRENE